jgi:paraquat-inducible protein B
LTDGEACETYYDPADEKNVTECETFTTPQKTTHSNTYAGQWVWNDEDAKTDQIELMFEPEGRTIGNVPLKAVNMGLANMLDGQLIRLAHTEMIINKNADIVDEDVTVNEEQDICSSWDSNGFCDNTKDGKRTIETNSTTTKSYSETWEKTDKEDSREDAVGGDDSGGDEE